MKFHSQVRQDEYLYRCYFRDRRGGTFVDIGAYDGIRYSNSCLFERQLGWQGLCIEPLPDIFEALKKNRRATPLNCAVSNFDGHAAFMDVEIHGDARMWSGLVDGYDDRHRADLERRGPKNQQTFEVRVRRLNDILAEHGLHHVDYCSIDTEGTEIDIVRDLDFDRFDISILSIENNFQDPILRDLMAERGYDLVQTFGGFDDLYVKRGVERLPVTTIICPIPGADLARDRDLWRGHQAMLDRQTHPVDSVYAVPAGISLDDAPDSLMVQASGVESPYELWNLALASVRTPFVMRVPVGHRLARDAVARFEFQLWRGKDIYVGDWQACDTQKEADAVEDCRTMSSASGKTGPSGRGRGVRPAITNLSAPQYETIHAWPPGSKKIPWRFPTRFADGTPIHSIGELLWLAGANNNKCQVSDVPFVVGRFVRDASANVDRRPAADAEWDRARSEGLIPEPKNKMGRAP